MLPRIHSGHDTYDGERRYLRPNGSMVWTSVHLTVIRDETGAPQHVFGQYHDITARKQLEEERGEDAEPFVCANLLRGLYEFARRPRLSTCCSARSAK